jgi:hypothetical protein
MLLLLSGHPSPPPPRSPLANIALSIIDGKLFAQGLLGKELFEKFDESGDGFITFEEMCAGIESMNLNVEHSWIRSLFKSIDDSGDGYISIDELHEALDVAYKYVRAKPAQSEERSARKNKARRKARMNHLR